MHADSATNTVDIESQPWSNNSPKGDEEFVLLACLPSIASKLWYMNRPSAHNAHVHLGGSSRPFGL